MPEEVDRLNENAKLIWGSAFQLAYEEVEQKRKNQKSVSPEEIDSIARKLYHQIKGQPIYQDAIPLDNLLCFGEFLKLSDLPQIGWHIDWEVRYAK